MYEPSFFRRLWKLGPKNLVLSWDTFIGLITFSIIYIYTGGGFPAEEANDILITFATVAAALFAIVLTGFTIIASFTDRLYLYVWQEIGEFENIVTTFQYNLILPVVVLLGTLVLLIEYNPVAMLVMIAVFVYMLFSLLDLLGFISRYALQRGEFISQQMENINKGRNQVSSEPFTEEELKEILSHLQSGEIKQSKREREDKK